MNTFRRDIWRWILFFSFAKWVSGLWYQIVMLYTQFPENTARTDRVEVRQRLFAKSWISIKNTELMFKKSHDDRWECSRNTIGKKTWKNFQALNGIRTHERCDIAAIFSGLFSSGVMAAFASIIVSMFNCYCWTSVTITVFCEKVDFVVMIGCLMTLTDR